MALLKKYTLADTTQEVDLRDFEDEILNTIEDTVPGKNPKVYEDYFTTDFLTHSEAVKIGRALSKNKKLAVYGKVTEIFRLFNGRMIGSADEPTEDSQQSTGGRKCK